MHSGRFWAMLRELFKRGPMKRIIPLAFGAASLVACAPADVSISLEEDGAVIAGDGETIPTEVFYEGGGWQIATECNETIEATGNAVGDITGSTALLAQTGDTVNIHDFCDRAILIVTGAFW